MMALYPARLAKPRFDQSTYGGRVKHFIQVTSPLNLFVTSRGLEDAKNLIKDYNAGRLPANIDPSKLWRAKESKLGLGVEESFFCRKEHYGGAQHNRDERIICHHSTRNPLDGYDP